MIPNSLIATDTLTQLIRDKGIYTWEKLLTYVKALPYGRNANRVDFSLVISEQKGSCSSKHALLKKVADLNHVPNIKLILGMYKMNQHNTPKIGNVLTNHHLDYMPEAHCYLNINGTRTDITASNSDFKALENDILEEIEIQPEQVADFKVTYHQNFMKRWILRNEFQKDFDEIWSIREQCIANLSK